MLPRLGVDLIDKCGDIPCCGLRSKAVRNTRIIDPSLFSESIHKLFQTLETSDDLEIHLLNGFVSCQIDCSYRKRVLAQRESE